MAEWQNELNLSCPDFHLIDLGNVRDGVESVRLVNNGYYRDVWMIREYNGKKIALKTLRYKERRHVGRDSERHRVEALAYEQLTASPYITNIYGYCMTDAIHDFGDGQDLLELFDTSPPPSKAHRLIIARDVAAGVADAHHVDDKGRATIAHTDIKPNNFIRLKGQYKLNDFNRAIMMTWDPKRNKTCGFDFNYNGGRVSLVATTVGVCFESHGLCCVSPKNVLLPSHYSVEVCGGVSLQERNREGGRLVSGERAILYSDW